MSLFRGMDEGDLKDLPSVWHDAALRALQLGEWGGTPRVRTIQCVLTFSFHRFPPLLECTIFLTLSTNGKTDWGKIADVK